MTGFYPAWGRRAPAGRAALCGALVLVASAAPAAVPQGAPRAPAELAEPLPEAAKDVRVRLENRSARPLTYQIGRPRGQVWSRSYTLAAGQAHEFKVAVTGANAWVLPTSHGAPGLMVRFPQSGGWMMHKLTPSLASENKAYAYVVNANGFGELVEARGEVIPLTSPGGEKERIAQLQANHCFQRP